MGVNVLKLNVLTPEDFNAAFVNNGGFMRSGCPGLKIMSMQM